MSIGNPGDYVLTHDKQLYIITCIVVSCDLPFYDLKSLHKVTYEISDTHGQQQFTNHEYLKGISHFDLISWGKIIPATEAYNAVHVLYG